jgi:hypothetical protein
LSDNYHQPVLGGTGPDSQPLGFADQVFFSDGKGNPATPAAKNTYNPDPNSFAGGSSPPGFLKALRRRTATTAPIAAITNRPNCSQDTETAE